MSRRKPMPAAYRAGGGTRVKWIDGTSYFPAGWVERQDGLQPGAINRLKTTGALDGVPGVYVGDGGGVWLSIAGQRVVLNLLHSK